MPKSSTPRAVRRLALALGTLALFACAKQQHHDGSVRVFAFTAGSAVVIDHVTVGVWSGSTLVVSHNLVLSGGVYQDILSGIPVGTYTFKADAYATASATAPGFSGSADGVTISATAIAFVSIVLHSDGPPISITGPSITSVTASTQTPHEGEAVRLNAVAQGTGVLTYTWTAQTGSFAGSATPLSTTGAQVTWNAPAALGPQTLTLSVADANGDSAALSLLFEVIADTGTAAVNVYLPPQITGLSAAQSPSTPTQWQLTLAVTLAPDGLALNYSWVSDPACPAGSGFDHPGTQQPLFTFAGSGTCTLTVTATDANPALGVGPSPFATGSVTLENGTVSFMLPPTITLGAQSAGAAAGNQVVYFDVSAIDNNTPPKTLTISWSGSDGAPLSATGPGFQWTAPFCAQPGGSTITATVANGSLTTSQVFVVLPAQTSAQPPQLCPAGAKCFAAHDCLSAVCSAAGICAPGSAIGGGLPQTLGVGTRHTCQLRGGALFCWGADGNGQLGDGAISNTGTPKPIPVSGPGGAVSFTAVAGGGNHTCAIDTAGAIWCWGDNSVGQLGTGTRTELRVPTRLPDSGAFVNAGFVYLSGNDNWSGNTCAIKSDQSLWCWGGNPAGEDGVGPGRISTWTQQPDHLVPARVQGSWVDVSVGSEFACGVDTGGVLQCWGRNDQGQVGLGHTDETSCDPYFSPPDCTAAVYTMPIPVSTSLTGWQHVSAGFNFACAIDSTGAAWCWGAGYSRQLGSTATTELAPAAISGGIRWSAIRLGDAHACGVSTEGKTYCWGANDSGQLGNAMATGNSSTPLEVPAADGATALDVRGEHTCAVVAGSTLCWGKNAAGETGGGSIGGFVSSPTPVAASSP